MQVLPLNAVADQATSSESFAMTDTAGQGLPYVIINASFAHAQAVYLVGDFNGWSLDHPLSPAIGDRWEMKLPGVMPRGEFCFMVINRGQTLGHLVYKDRSPTFVEFSSI